MNDEQAIKYIERKLEKKKVVNQIWLDTRAYLRYIRSVKKGDWSIYVPEFEQKIREKLKERNEMEKSRVLIRVTKDYQVVEVEVSEIQGELDFEQAKDWALSQARETLAQLPTGTTTQSKKDYTTQTRTQEQPKHKSGKVTLQDLTLKEGSEKQHGFLVEGINKGFFTLDEINEIADYSDVSSYVKKFFELNKK